MSLPLCRAYVALSTDYFDNALTYPQLYLHYLLFLLFYSFIYIPPFYVIFINILTNCPFVMLI